MLETSTTSAEFLVALGGVQRYPHKDIELCIIKNFLRPVECESLIQLIDEKRRPSTIADANGDDYFRTSETCDLDHHDPFVTEIDQKICNFADIHPKYGEPLQGQRYAVGQEFKAHTDYFDPDGLDFKKFCTISGQRTWTFMIYLNEPGAGGATSFTHLNKKFVPKTGTLLCWNNMRADGTVNDRTMHHGMKVRSGTKYVITKWYRERPWPWSPE
ncbi:2OG-Fe(II) oxygenase [Parasphingorhabdus sp.]|uniref:prolyl hydroxylase family protein n=1 Tax=Parasphingorhabdus sp. TaxID=2709688 RepID=UPI003262E96B